MLPVLVLLVMLMLVIVMAVVMLLVMKLLELMRLMVVVVDSHFKGQIILNEKDLKLFLKTRTPNFYE